MNTLEIKETEKQKSETLVSGSVAVIEALLAENVTTIFWISRWRHYANL